MQNDIQQLLQKLFGNDFNEADRAQFEKLLKDENQKDAIIDAIHQIIQKTKLDEVFDEQRFMPLLKQILDADKSSLAKAKVIVNWRRIAVAASIILAVGVGGYALLLNKSGNNVEIAVPVTRDVEAPKRAKAMITLADGRNIVLDSVASGRLATEVDAEVIKTPEGQIVYNTELKTINTNLVYNTLTNPRGSKVVEMVWADGSHVWLNAGASVTYPVSFTGKERVVSMSGEAYFEVARNDKVPFLVKVNNMTVKVLGTHFNINSYKDEATIKTTLLEGSIKVIKGNDSLLIAPGQQAQVSNIIRLIKAVDLDEVMAWKKGLFIFNNADIQTIMRQISNCYDLDVIYEGNIKKETFSGIVTRDNNISTVLKIIEEAGIKYRIEDKKLIIMY